MEPPQHLSPQAIDEFTDIFREEFRQDLSEDEAQEMAIRLLRLFDILLQPLPSNTRDQSAIGESHS